MRKIVVVISTILLLMISAFSVNAESVELILSSQDAYVNRSFDVSVASECSCDIGGGMLTLSFDSDAVEFKGVKSKCFDVKYKKSDSSVKFVFVLNECMCEDDKLFDLTFKSKCEKESNIKLVSNELVDRKLIRKPTVCLCDVVVKGKNYSSKTASDNEVDALNSDKNIASTDSYSVKGSGSAKMKTALYSLSGAGVLAAVFINVKLLFKKQRVNGEYDNG